MSTFTLLYDEPHEAEWFRNLHPLLGDAKEEALTTARHRPALKKVLAYDRPDIILLDGDTPILVVEQTVEVPSGHNVGQRFARIAAAAEAGVPCLYFGPYVAKKHGGATAGPRYMNVRLFHALDALRKRTRTAVTSINWPADDRREVRRDPDKDAEVKEYIATFLDLYTRSHNLRDVNYALSRCSLQKRLLKARDEFVATSIRRRAQYNKPPRSVEILTRSVFARQHCDLHGLGRDIPTVVTYKIGMRRMRADPYTGTAILYRYLYTPKPRSRMLVLWFSNIPSSMWPTKAKEKRRKDVRLFRLAAKAILFSDQLVPKANL